MKAQLIFRQVRETPFEISELSDVFYVHCDRIYKNLPVLGPLFRSFGVLKAVKVLLKMATPRRSFFGTIREGRLASYGHVSFGFCRHYDVERTAVVIGPVWTAERFRGQGLATHALMCAMNALMDRGYRIFYIDTSADNIPMQRVIEKCEFGVHTKEFEHT